MNKRQTSLSFLFALVIVVANIQLTFAQTLPVNVKSFLNKNYAGWKQSATNDTDCYADFRKLVVIGDFDGNGKRDYAVRMTHNRRGYLMALLGQNADYRAHVLLSVSATELKGYGMSLAKKGSKYSIGDPYEGDNRTARLPNDAPVIGPCGSHAYPYIYRNGRFAN